MIRPSRSMPASSATSAGATRALRSRRAALRSPCRGRCGFASRSSPRSSRRARTRNDWGPLGVGAVTNRPHSCGRVVTSAGDGARTSSAAFVSCGRAPMGTSSRRAAAPASDAPVIAVSASRAPGAVIREPAEQASLRAAGVPRRGRRGPPAFRGRRNRRQRHVSHPRIAFGPAKTRCASADRALGRQNSIRRRRSLPGAPERGRKT